MKQFQNKKVISYLDEKQPIELTDDEKKNLRKRLEVKGTENVGR
jgi:hypothetical protein